MSIWTQMVENDDTVQPQVWDREDLESFLKFRNPAHQAPPVIGEHRRSGALGERPTPSAGSQEGTGDRSKVPETRSQNALAAFLSPESVQRLGEVLNPEGLELNQAPSLVSALESVVSQRPDFVFTGLEFEPLHAPSLIAALKACPSHRSIPIAVVTPQDPRLLDLSLYRPDATVGEAAQFGVSIRDFLNEFRVVDRSVRGSEGPRVWARFVGRVLLVENSAMAQRIIGKLLHVAGADVTLVESPSEAMLVTASREFDLVLLDLEIPGANTGDLVRFLRAVLPGVPIVGNSAQSTDPARHGVDAILHKPVRRAHLFSLCSRLLAQPGIRRTG